MRYWIGFISTLISFFLLGTATSALPTVVERIVAIVDGEVILQSELDEMTRKFREEVKKEKPPKDLGRKEEVQRNVLDQMINDQLVSKEISRRGFSVTEAQIDGALASVMKQNCISSLADLKVALASEGFTLESYRDSLKKQLENGRLMNEVIRSKIEITDEDILAAHRRSMKDSDVSWRYNVSMIFRTKANSSLDEAQEIKRKIDIGVPFEREAKRLSEGPAASEGGNIGFVRPDQMKPELGKVLKGMKDGEVSNVISTKEGFYILYVSSRESAGDAPLSESQKEHLRKELLMKETEHQFDSFVRNLRENANVEVLI